MFAGFAINGMRAILLFFIALALADIPALWLVLRSTMKPGSRHLPERFDVDAFKKREQASRGLPGRMRR